MSDLLNKLYKNEKITNYKIYTDKCIYTTTIEENSLTNSFYLYLGGPFSDSLGTNKGCVIIYINDYKESDIAILDSIKYDSKCNITEDLEEGVGSQADKAAEGTKHMIFTALNILMYYFPHLKYVKLLDTRFKKYSRVNKIGATPSMELAVYFMLFHKKTWYESLFGALPIAPNNLAKYKVFISKLDSIPIDKPFFTFIKQYFRDNDLKYIVDLNNKYNLEFDKLYNTTKTYSEFFNKLKDKINDKSEICSFFGIFLFRFMDDISNKLTTTILEDYWIFSTDIINTNKIKFREEQVDVVSLNGGEYFTELL